MHGAGNDFIVIGTGDQAQLCALNEQLISALCNRNRGVGADGLIILSPVKRCIASGSSEKSPLFRMSFFNNDGKSADMCGNGLRCAALYAKKYLTGREGPVLFETGAGVLETEILDRGEVQIQIPLLEQPSKVRIDNVEYITVNTGVPHLIAFVPDVSVVDIVKYGRRLRYNHLFKPDGVNVDFISIPEEASDPVLIRTYERGVEDETSACGTGIAAAAVALVLFYDTQSPIAFMSRDKDVITIDFSFKENMVREIQEIRLTGPVEEVFKGELNNDFLGS